MVQRKSKIISVQVSHMYQYFHFLDYIDFASLVTGETRRVFRELIVTGAYRLPPIHERTREYTRAFIELRHDGGFIC